MFGKDYDKEILELVRQNTRLAEEILTIKKVKKLFDNIWIQTFMHAVPIGMLAGWTGQYLYTFFHAYSTPNKMLLIQINIFHEANIEFAMNIVGIFVVAVYLIYIYKNNMAFPTSYNACRRNITQ